MRLLQLDLERYGHFTDKRLEFRPDACLHVVYGRNEAGKSSSLDAIGDLLFGFPHSTRYDFVHDKTRLGIGATIENKDALRLSFKRRKGTKNTLLDEANQPLPEDALQPFLGGVNKTVFAQAFGLSKESLRAGAQEMLRNGGEAGSSLIAAAAGLKGLSELRKQLETEAAALFAPTRSQNRSFYQARDRQEQAARSIRELELRARDLKERQARITALEASLESIRRDRISVVQQREGLTRQREIGPLLLSIAANEELLQAYPHLPAVDAAGISQLRRACDAWEKQAAEVRRLTSDLAGAVATAEGYVVDTSLLARAPVIQTLVAESGNYTAEKAHLPRVRAEAAQFSATLDDCRVRLGLAPEAEIASLRPSDMAIVRVKEQIAEGKRLEANGVSLDVAIRKEQANREELLKQQSDHAGAGDPQELRDRLARLMPTLSHLPEVSRLERAVAKEGELLRERAAQLSPAVLDLDALAERSLPSAKTIAEFASSAERLARDLAALDAAVGESERALPGLRAAVEAEERQPLESTPERIAEARARRTALWAPLRSTLLGEAAPLASGEAATRVVEFEQSIQSSDRLADGAVRHADRLAARAAALNRLQEEQQRHEQAQARVTRKEAEIAAHREEWNGLWAPLGLVPGPASRMEGWLSQVGDLRMRREALRESRRDLEEKTAAVRSVEPALQELGRLAAIAEADALPAGVLLNAIQEEIERRAGAWRKSHQVQALLKASKDRLAGLEGERNAQRKAAGEWQQAWEQVTASIHLPAAASLDQAEAALEVWRKVPSALAQLEDRTGRVQGMKRDMQSFETRTAALLEQLGELDAGLGADAAIKALAERLTRALQTESKAHLAQQRVAELQATIVTAEANEASAREALETLSAGLPETAQRSEQVGQLEAREEILKALRDQRQTLAPLSRGHAEAELRQAMESFDDAAAAAQIEELNARQTQLSQEENETFANLREAQNQLAALENGVGAEVAAQLKRNAEAQLVQVARAWGVKRIAHMLLSHAIERFRSQQEAPLLKRAGELFAAMTAGSFSGVEQEYGEDDEVELVGRRESGDTVDIEGMSEGTRDQLYLALRLAYLEDYAGKTEPLPFIGDDLLTNFDDERTKRGLAALAEVGRRVQPILFTHHQRVVDFAVSELGSSVDVISLD